MILVDVQPKEMLRRKVLPAFRTSMCMFFGVVDLKFLESREWYRLIVRWKGAFHYCSCRLSGRCLYVLRRMDWCICRRGRWRLWRRRKRRGRRRWGRIFSWAFRHSLCEYSGEEVTLVIPCPILPYMMQHHSRWRSLEPSQEKYGVFGDNVKHTIYKLLGFPFCSSREHMVDDG